MPRVLRELDASQDPFALWLTTTGVLLLFGMVAALVAARVALPRVTLLILAGLLVGPGALDLLPAEAESWRPMASSAALLFVGFLLGGRLRLSILRAHGRQILAVASLKVLASAVVVALGLIAVGVDLTLALLAAGVATATAPAAVQSVVQETRSDGPFTETLLGVVALDDAFGLMLFALLLTAAGALAGLAADGSVLARAGWEIGAALALGLAVGLPAGWLSRRLRAGEPLEAEAVGVVMLCGGLALMLDVSFLIAAMTLGAVVANLAEDNDQPFHIIAKAEWPLLVVFFVLSGAAVRIEDLAAAGWITLAYIILRSIGLNTGAAFGASVSGMSGQARLWIGPALLPQAGVALGMALIAGQEFPGLADRLLTIVVASTVVFELIGPILTRMALDRTGEMADPTRT